MQVMMLVILTLLPCQASPSLPPQPLSPYFAATDERVELSCEGAALDLGFGNSYDWYISKTKLNWTQQSLWMEKDKDHGWTIHGKGLNGANLELSEGGTGSALVSSRPSSKHRSRSSTQKLKENVTLGTVDVKDTKKVVDTINKFRQNVLDESFPQFMDKEKSPENQPMVHNTTPKLDFTVEDKEMKEWMDFFEFNELKVMNKSEEKKSIKQVTPVEIHEYNTGIEVKWRMKKAGKSGKHLEVEVNRSREILEVEELEVEVEEEDISRRYQFLQLWNLDCRYSDFLALDYLFLDVERHFGLFSFVGQRLGVVSLGMDLQNTSEPKKLPERTYKTARKEVEMV
ncbi:hypothetical protein GLOIN_2v1840063 [Rhizophagus irregularis DAOM 181602=DAOM 197198]|nr:hypothetical protein GLOIN_2v1840063 [Rhizophagus irregularis DAOM 181602=DAOM 197198]